MRRLQVFRIEICVFILLVSADILATSGQIFAQTSSWDTKTPMQTARYPPGAVVINNSLYVLGGGVGGSCGQDRTYTMESYNPATDSWGWKASMPTARGWLGTGEIGGIIYAAGGRSTSVKGISTLEAYDPLTDSWTGKAPMPTRRAAPSAGVIGGKLYVAGGFIDDADTGTLGTLEAYDPETNSWTAKMPLQIGRSHAGAGVINGKLYVAGGISGNRELLNSLEVYDPSTDTWTSLTGMPTKRAMPGVAAFDGKLYVVGGTNSSSTEAPPIKFYDELEIYNPASDTWSTGPKLPTPRSGPAVGWIGHKLYVAGGCGASSSLPTLEVFTPRITITATAQGSVNPPARATFPDKLTNGDFEIVGSARDPLVGDGADEGTLWTFDFRLSPEYADFPNTGAVISAILTVTLTPRGADINNDQVGIRRLGVRSATPEIHALTLNETKTVQVELASPGFYPGAAILDALVRSSGTLAMLFTDDATVSFAQLVLIAEDQGGS